MQGTIAAPDATTCNESTYDFFVVANKLHPAVVGVSCIYDAGFSPPSPARLYLAGHARRKQFRRLVRPPRVAADLPAGPASPSAAADWPALASDDLAALDQALTAWYTTSRSYFGQLLGEPMDWFAPLLPVGVRHGPVGPAIHGGVAHLHYLAHLRGFRQSCRGITGAAGAEP